MTDFVSDNSPAVRQGLLDVATDRATAEVAVTVLPPLLAWYGHALTGTLELVPWAVGMAAIAPLLHLARRRYRRERDSGDTEKIASRWERRLAISAGLYGLAWSVPPLLVLQDAPAVFMLVFFMVLQGVCIGATAHLSAVAPAFAALVGGVWLPALGAMPTVFPEQWLYLLPMFALFTAVVSRHGWGMYRFVQRQLHAEEQGRELARRYREAKEAAEAALRERSLFLATASHDLRQPVHAMTLLVEAVARRNQDAAVDPLLADLRNAMESMNLMFNSLLDLSRLDAGRFTPAPTTVVLAELLAEVAAMFREQATRRGLQLRVHPAPPGARVLADPLLMRQAVVNLVHNGLRYTAQGGLLLGVRRRGALWQIDVVDTGVGIADQDNERIFSPFYRNEHAWRIDSAGHGLGLAVVTRCAQKMGAELGFRSRLGQGSRFWLRLPAASGSAVESEHVSEPSTTPREERVLPGSRCLILDDDPLVRASWQAMLGGWGVDVRCADSGIAALDILAQGFAPQAILCDQRLRSGESGFEVLHDLLDRCPDASGAMVSGEFGSPELLEAESEGYIVLRKPVDPEQLHALLSTWIDHRTSPST